jgi:hypothetical protein
MTDAERIELWPTRHAVDRFHERVRPALSWKDARAELLRLMSNAKLVSRPNWAMTQLTDDAVCAELCDGIVAVCTYKEDKCMILTVLVRGVKGESVRTAMRAARRNKRARQ